VFFRDNRDLRLICWKPWRNATLRLFMAIPDCDWCEFVPVL